MSRERKPQTDFGRKEASGRKEIKEELDAAVRECGAGREMSVLMDFLGLSKLTREQVDRWIDRIIVRREELEIHWKEKEF